MGAELGHIVGIDLGTTNSVVAVVENDQPVVLTTSEGSTRLPSVVAFSDDPAAPPIVGELAKRQAVMNPGRTIVSVKRLMGRSLDEIADWRDELPYEVVEEQGRLLIKMGDVGYTPSQISAFILQKLKKTAEEYLGEPVDKAVITVPAYFDDLQRQATYEAAELAGLQVMRLLNEPTAAAIAYGLGRDREERVVVYDFGGGTFDVTILEIAGQTFEVLTSLGDTRLGGDDIDALLFNHLLTGLRKQLGDEYIPDALTTQRLREAAEKGKCELSYSRQTTVSLPFIAYKGSEPVHLEVTIRRTELEAMIRPLVDRTIECCERALESCRLRPEDIDRVILVGGTTRIPCVQQAVEDFFGLAPYKGINPDEIVAIGAAMQGAILQGQLKEVVLLDVTPHSLGIEVESGKVSRVVERNSTIPIKAAKLFTTTEDNQEAVVVHVVQGEGEKVSECRSLGKFVLTNIQKAKAGIPRIQVTFHINADGMVEVSAQDLATQQEAGITVAVVPGAEEEKEKERRRRRRRPRGAETAKEEVVAGPAAGGVKIERHITVQRQAAPGFEPLHSAQPGELRPQPLRTRDTAEARTAKGESASKEGKVPAPEEKTVVADLFELPTPATLPCSPATRGLLEELRAAGFGERRGSDEALVLACQELGAVVRAMPDKPGVWPWWLYLLFIRGEGEEMARGLIQWAASKAPDCAQIPDFIHALGLEIGAPPHVAAAMAMLAVAREDWDTAWELLAPWRDSAELPEEIAAILATVAKQRLEQKADPETELILARSLVQQGKYDEALSLLERLAAVPGFEAQANKLLAVCCLKKELFYLAWKKLQVLPPTDDVKALMYDLAQHCNEATSQRDLMREIYSYLANLNPPYRDALEQFTKLASRVASSAPPIASVPTELEQVAAVFADSRFVILDEINRGSMGVIYRARDKVLDEIVALKVLNDYLAADPASLERFKREARAAKRLSHPNIVRIHDMYEVGPKRLLSMEYIPGRDLKTILRKTGPLPCEEIVRIGKAVCEALAHAHSLGIVHRDIKPANIMITDDGAIKVTDFGIAKFMLQSADITRSGSQVVGTPLYMAPEQIKGGEVDARSDIYALGVTLYELATGVPPFRDGNIEYHHLHTPPPPLGVPLPLELAESILKCLAKNPQDRFQSAEELRDALANVDCSGL